MNCYVPIGLAAALILPGLFAGPARADFFKYRDSSGAMVITNRLEDVPKKYRNKVKVVWDKDLEAKDSLARRKAAAKARREADEQQRAQSAPRESTKSTEGKTLVIEFDEATGQLIRRFE